MSAPLVQLSGFEKRPRTIVIGTAGHIDHGKTALIRALTGVDTDRLPEEKKRGITIDLGFASLDLAGPGGFSVRASFIDVPGHARFVRNMLAGAGGIDAVLMVISAEEGVKPQTEEHLAICSLLGIQRGITVLTKADAVDATRLEEVRSSVETFLSTTFLDSEPLIFASVLSGAGLDLLRHELSLLAMRIPERNAELVARMPIDRAFAVKGFGAVVTGTLMTGALTSGQELAIEPGGKTAKVRGLQVHGRAAVKAEGATRVALNLGRVEAAELQRGDTLVEPSMIVAVDIIDAEVTLLPGSGLLKHRARVHFHAFATEYMSMVSLYGYRPVEANSSRLARLRLTRPIVLLPGDRFVLRHGSPITTIGGGVVLDVHPLQRLKKVRTQQWLQEILAANAEEQLALRVARRGTAGITLADLSRETGLKADAINGRLRPLVQSGKLCSLKSGLFLSPGALLEASNAVQGEMDKAFQAGGSASVKRAALRSQVPLHPEVLEWALNHLEQNNQVRISGQELLAPTKYLAANSLDEERLIAVERAYRQAGLEAPLPGNLAAELRIDSAQLRKFITILLRERILVRLGDDSLCVHQTALGSLRESVRSMRGRTIDIAAFKELTGVSRKYAIPLLEYLDRERVTRRQGDLRIVL